MNWLTALLAGLAAACHFVPDVHGFPVGSVVCAAVAGVAHALPSPIEGRTNGLR